MITQQKKSVNEGKKTSAEQTETLIRTYKKTRWVTNSERLGKPDALSAWFSIRDLETFLAETKSQGGDGIKFYFGAYPEDYTDIPEYAGRQTLVTIGTKSKITETGTVVNKDIYISEKGQTKILGFYTLPVLCPPLCPSNSEGGTGHLGLTIIDKGVNGMEII